jgi:integrase
VDLQADVVRLRPELSKNREGRILPLSTPLRAVMERRMEARTLESPRVFHLKGRPIGDWRRAWATACNKAGLPGKLFHDLRRTAVRNLIRAGVPERVAMSITGHKTRSIFDRYHIVNEVDTREATNRLAAYLDGHPEKRKIVPLRGMGSGE